MMRRLLAVLCVGAVGVFSGAAAAQEVKFDKYTLDNGMTVILHEDHSLPVAGINIWYHVGAKDEPPHRSGFAHLFEHLMFMGTQRVPTGGFDTIMEGGGGSNNASTAFDRTNYFSSGPASLLPTLLWLDSDRLEDLGRTMNQDKLDHQRKVVLDERSQSIENAPYGKAELLITSIMFPDGHPYHNEVIGTREDIENAQVLDVKDFFANYYVPNNASLVVWGDFDPAKIKPPVAQLFGTIKRGLDPIHKTAAPVKLDKVMRATTLDAVQLPKICIAYESPANLADGDAEMDLVAAVLSQGKSSRLYKRLVLDDKLAIDVTASQNGNKLQGNFRIDIMAQPGADLDRVEREVDEEVSRLLNDGVKADELDQRKATVELSKLSQLQAPSARADKLNEYEYYFGDPDGFKRDLDRYRNATTQTVQTWAKKVLTQDARLIVRVLPDQPERGKTARDTRPEDFSSTDFSPHAPQTFKLSNGVPVMLWSKRELPLVAMSVFFHPGGPLDDPAHAGRTELTSTMLGEGAGDLDAVQFNDAVQALGATFSSGSSTESATVGATVLKRNFEKAAGLVAQAIEHPRMETKDWDRIKDLHIKGLIEEQDQPQVAASHVGARMLFGQANPYGWPVGGTIETAKKVTLDEVKAQHDALYRPEDATILISGDLTQDEAKSILDKTFGSWKASGAPAKHADAGSLMPKPGEALRVALVEKPGAVQTVIRFMAPGAQVTDPRRVKLRLLNELLGGGFTSRLNLNLREEHGYAYGAGSRFVMTPSTGYFIASADVKADETGASLKEFFSEFERIRKGDVSPEEVAKSRESLRTEMIQHFTGLSGVLGVASGLIEAGLPFETLSKDAAAMTTVSNKDLDALAPQALPIEKGVLVLVGDKAVILDQIKDLNLPKPVEYTAEGEVK
jgi:predicted Zn-dependent peptidase